MALGNSGDQVLQIVVRLKDEASKALAAIQNQVNSDIKKYGSSFEASANASRQFGLALGGVTLALAGVGAIGVKTAGQLEASRQGFYTLLGSAQAADKVMADIKKEAMRTPFEIAGLTSAVQLMSSVTHDGTKALKVVMDIGEGLSAMGKGQAELDRVAVNLQQIAAMGRAFTVDIKQFAYAGLPIYDMLTEKTGLAGEALAKFIEEGGVTFDLLAETFDKANDKGGRFFNGFINQAGTFNQLMSNLKDTVNIFLADFVKGSGIFDAVKDALKAMTDFLSEHRDDIMNFAKNGITFLRENIPIVSSLIVGALAPAIWSAVVALGAMAVELGPIVLLFGAAGALYQGIKNGSAALVALAGAVTTAVIPAFIALSIATKTVGVSFSTAYIALGPYAIAIGAAATAIALLVEKYYELKEAQQQVKDAQAQAITTFQELINTGKKQIEQLEKQKEGHNAEVKAYITGKQQQLEALNRVNEIEIRLTNLSVEVTKNANEIKMGSNRGYVDKSLIATKERLANEVAALTAEKDENRKTFHELLAQRDELMEARLKIGDKEVDARLKMVEKANASEKVLNGLLVDMRSDLRKQVVEIAKGQGLDEEKVRNAVLAMTGDVSQKEVNMFVAKSNAQLAIAQLFKTKLAELMNNPVIQSVRVAFTSSSDPIQNVVAGIRSIGNINVGSALSSIGTSMANLGKDVLGLMQGMSGLNAESTKVTTALNSVGGGLAKTKSGAGGAADETKKLEAAAKKAEEQLKKLNDKVGDNWKAYGDLRTKAKAALTDLAQAHNEKIGQIQGKIDDLSESLTKLSEQYGKDLGEQGKGIAEQFVDQEKKVSDIKKELAAEQAKNGSDADQERIAELQTSLTKEQAALSANSDIAIQYADQVAEARKRQSMTDFERSLDDLAKKKQQIDEEYQAKKKVLDQEIVDLQEQRAKEDALFEQKKEALTKVQKAVNAFGTAWGKAFTDMQTTTQKKVDDMDRALELLQKRLQAILDLQKQTNTTSAPPAATVGMNVPHLAEGGIVDRPTLALIGEAGSEAVVPLGKGNGIGGQTVINVTINNPMVPDVRQFEGVINNAFRNLMRNYKFST